MYKISLRGEFEVLVHGRKQIVFFWGGGGGGGGAELYGRTWCNYDSGSKFWSFCGKGLNRAQKFLLVLWAMTTKLWDACTNC